MPKPFKPKQSKLDGKISEPSRNNSYANEEAIFCFLPVTSMGESRRGLTVLCVVQTVCWALKMFLKSPEETKDVGDKEEEEQPW